ncbi:MAG: sigma-70 family RNA polymerase sigma factor [Pseudomonadota bacterium]
MSKATHNAETQRLFDEYLVLALRSGDRAAGERLAARWRPRLLRTARRLIGDATAAEDVVQDTWIGIARGVSRLKDPARFPAWAFGILQRRCADHHRRHYRERERVATLGDSDGATASRAQARLELDDAFAQLTHEHRTAAVLFYGEGLTLAEIATATAVPLGTAKSRLFHARRQLRDLLEGDLS